MAGEEALALKFTTAVRPALLRLIPDLPLEPATMFRLDGMALTVKLPVTVTVKTAWWIKPPLVAVTVTV